MVDEKDNLIEAVQTEKIDAIDKLIEDIYNQRKEGLAADGEYSEGNLLFKEFRNRGYLDKLKELKNELIGKELSLAEALSKTKKIDILEKISAANTELENVAALLNGCEDAELDEIVQDIEFRVADINSIAETIRNLQDETDLSLAEDTEKVKDHKWVNRGKEGTHGEFKTKKEADAQRKAMFANGFSESLADKTTLENISKTTLQEDNEFGKYKAVFIKSILQANPTALHKGAESRKIYNKTSNEMEEKLLWDSVLHHNDGDHNNNDADFSNYTLIQCDNYSTAMFVHRLVHLLSIVKEELTEEVKNKIRDCNAEFITLSDNKLTVQDFDSWWNSIGNIIVEFASDKIINMQPNNINLIDERLDERQRIDYKDELSRIAFNQAIIFDSGLFKIYNVKENDVNRIITQIRNLDYIEWVNKNAGRYDFGKVAMFGQPQARYYEITGQIKN